MGGKFFFFQQITLERFIAEWILASEGCITLKISGKEENQSIFIPVIVAPGIPANGISRLAKKKHRMLAKKNYQI